MGFLLAAVTLFALLSGAVAAGQAVAITRQAAVDGPTWRDWLFGWWRFDAIAARAGLAGEEQAAAYKRSVIACVVFVVLGLILSGWVVNQRPAASPAAVSIAPNHDWRVLPARFAEHFELRRVAPMPGVTMLES
ncbi:MAG: hypothetical protein KIS86_16720 [Devosia sp.]|nr:hypothetical protein [Devosia sp.]